jgi:hypothetical protein
LSPWRPIDDEGNAAFDRASGCERCIEVDRYERTPTFGPMMRIMGRLAFQAASSYSSLLAS